MEETHLFTPNLINEFRFGFIHTDFGYTPPFQNDPLSANLGIVNANVNASGQPDPQLGGGALIGGFNSQLEYTGDYGPYLVPQNTWQTADNLSWVKGKHTMKFGANILRRQVNFFRPLDRQGLLQPVRQRTMGLSAEDQSRAMKSPTFSSASPATTRWDRCWAIPKPATGKTASTARTTGALTPRLTLNLGLALGPDHLAGGEVQSPGQLRHLHRADPDRRTGRQFAQLYPGVLSQLRAAHRLCL